LYECAKQLDHGCNTLSHVYAAHAILLAYNNLPKAKALLDAQPDSAALQLCKMNLELLSSMQPLAPDWRYLVKICRKSLEAKLKADEVGEESDEEADE